jgi:hypothetical protein
LIEKELITREEFMQKISEERATQKLLNPNAGKPCGSSEGMGTLLPATPQKNCLPMRSDK